MYENIISVYFVGGGGGFQYFSHVYSDILYLNISFRQQADTWKRRINIAPLIIDKSVSWLHTFTERISKYLY